MLAMIGRFNFISNSYQTHLAQILWKTIEFLDILCKNKVFELLL